VRPISLKGLALFGIGPDNRLYWDGQFIKIERTISLNWWQNLLAAMTAFGAAAGGVAALLTYFAGHSASWVATRQGKTRRDQGRSTRGREWTSQRWESSPKAKTLADAGISTSTAQRYERLAGGGDEKRQRVARIARENYFAKCRKTLTPGKFDGLSEAVEAGQQVTHEATQLLRRLAESVRALARCGIDASHRLVRTRAL
jgi:hypothetical protein